MDRVGGRLNYPAGPMPFGPVRTFGPIPPMRQRFARLWAPPVHEATGGYAVRRAQGHAGIIQSEKGRLGMKACHFERSEAESRNLNLLFTIQKKALPLH